MCLGALTRLSAWANEPAYTALTIKSSLSKGADAVIRAEETVFTVHSPKSASEKVRRVVAVMNADGKRHARAVVYYDKLSKVDYIKATVYDMLGKKVKALKNSDIKDESANGDDIGDNRVKVADLTYTAYPYTVEYEYQTTTSNMLFYPFWSPIDAEKLSVEEASFKVIMPAGLALRYKEQLMPEKASVTQVGSQQVYTWQVKDLAPYEEEPLGPDLWDMVPAVKTAPSNFEVEAYAGTMDSWESLGKFYSKLNMDRGHLPEQTKQQILALTKNITDPKEKVKAVYQFMQNKTRYVSIQLGIGGWQPFEASLVDSKGYGDCKALSNYTKSLLEVIDIPSHYAIIYGGKDNRPMMKNFPSNQFNHVILCVPMAKDTVWLECTSQTDDAGYTGSFTGDRYSLLVTPEGGKLVPTPRFAALDNKQLRSVQVKLNAQGSGTGEAFTQYQGIQHEEHNQVILNYKPEDQLKWLYKNTQIPAFEIKKYSLEKVKDQPEVKEKLQLDLPRVASATGKRLFITPNLMNRWDHVPAMKENRTQDVIWPLSFHDVDSVEYEIPAGYKPESVPQPSKIASAFGEYQAQVQIKGNKLVYVRQLTMHKGRYEPATYKALVEFLKQVSRADQQQVVLAATTI